MKKLSTAIAPLFLMICTFCLTGIWAIHFGPGFDEEEGSELWIDSDSENDSGEYSDESYL